MLESLRNASATAVRVDQSKYVTICYHSSSIPCLVESKICKVKLLWHPDVIFNILCVQLNSQFLTNCCKETFTSHKPGFRPLLLLVPLFFFFQYDIDVFYNRSWCFSTCQHPTSVHAATELSSTFRYMQNSNVSCFGLVTLKFLRQQSGE